MEFLSEYGLFLAKTITFMVAVLFVAGSLASLAQRHKKSGDWQLEVTKLNERFKHYRDEIEHHLLDRAELKRRYKAEKKALKERQKTAKNAASGAEDPVGRVFVLDFHGDIRASEVSSFREAVTALLGFVTSADEIVVRLESPGGMVHSYGLAASQMARLRSAGIPLTVCVDKVAASGGYLMACIANRIIAAPFAVIGSIGVVAQIPNVNRLLKRHDIDVEVLTAGEYKRTLTILGENTPKGREKFQQDLEETHELFKQWVADYRPHLNIEDVAKGEVWYGSRALQRGLIDAVQTSDDYLLGRTAEVDVFHVRYLERKKLAEKLGLAMASAVESAGLRLHRWLGPGN